jgi:hypothetical protein
MAFSSSLPLLPTPAAKELVDCGYIYTCHPTHPLLVMAREERNEKKCPCETVYLVWTVGDGHYLTDFLLSSNSSSWELFVRDFQLHVQPMSRCLISTSSDIYLHEPGLLGTLHLHLI